jgi:hypothetical protein
MHTHDHPAELREPRRVTSSTLKEKAMEEFRMFWIIAIYLAAMLGAFTWYRRFLLSEIGVSYIHYGAAVIEALILAKVILIGKALGLGRRFEDSPLILSVLFKSLVFGVFIGIFGVLEHVVEGLVHRDSWEQIGHTLVSAGRDEILARAVMIVVTLIPFFAFWEADTVLGDHKLFALFFHRREA